MRRIFTLALLPLVLSGCALTAGIQGAGQQIPGAVGQLDDVVYEVAIAKYQAAQRFQAQVNGTMPVLPQLPPPVIGTPMNPGLPVVTQPVPVPTPSPTPTPTPTPVPPAPIPAPKPVPVVP